MIDVAVYLDNKLAHPDQWNEKYYDEFLLGIKNAIHHRILMDKSSVPISFHCRGRKVGAAPAWFAGALFMTRVLMDYTCAYVTGIFIEGPAGKFQAAEITSQNIYDEGINQNLPQTLEDLVYHIPTEQLPKQITFTIGSEKTV